MNYIKVMMITSMVKITQIIIISIVIMKINLMILKIKVKIPLKHILSILMILYKTQIL